MQARQRGHFVPDVVGRPIMLYALDDRETMKSVAAQLVKNELATVSEISDGHFIPYFGRHVVRKGYFTVRRLAMKGHQAYYANDPQGRPFFFLPTPASDQLTAVIPRMIDQVKAIVGDRWVGWVLTLIFDRGGFCAALFKLLDELKVHWITWLKPNRELRQVLDQLPEEGFRRHLISPEDDQGPTQVDGDRGVPRGIRLGPGRGHPGPEDRRPAGRHQQRR